MILTKTIFGSHMDIIFQTQDRIGEQKTLCDHLWLATSAWHFQTGHPLVCKKIARLHLRADLWLSFHLER